MEALGICILCPWLAKLSRELGEVHKAMVHSVVLMQKFMWRTLHRNVLCDSKYAQTKTPTKYRTARSCPPKVCFSLRISSASVSPRFWLACRGLGAESSSPLPTAMAASPTGAPRWTINQTKSSNSTVCTYLQMNTLLFNHFILLFFVSMNNRAKSETCSRL